MSTELGVILYLQARSSLAGTREFNQWLGITSSNKTWLWLICMLIIGACIGYITITLYNRRKVKKNDS